LETESRQNKHGQDKTRQFCLVRVVDVKETLLLYESMLMLIGFCSREIAAITEMSDLLQQEQTRNTDELEQLSRKNAEMFYVLSMATPTLKDLLNSVSIF